MPAEKGIYPITLTKHTHISVIHLLTLSSIALHMSNNWWLITMVRSFKLLPWLSLLYTVRIQYTAREKYVGLTFFSQIITKRNVRKIVYIFLLYCITCHTQRSSQKSIFNYEILSLAAARQTLWNVLCFTWNVTAVQTLTLFPHESSFVVASWSDKPVSAQRWLAG